MKTFTKYLILLAVFTNLLAMDDEDRSLLPNPFFTGDIENLSSPTTREFSGDGWAGLDLGISEPQDHIATSSESEITAKTVVPTYAELRLDAPLSDNPLQSTFSGGFYWLDAENANSYTVAVTSAAKPLLDTAIEMEDAPFEYQPLGIRTIRSELPEISSPAKTARKIRKKTSPAASASPSSCSTVSSAAGPSSAAAPKLALSATRSSRSHHDKYLDKYIVLTQRLPCLWPLTTVASTTVCNEKFENLEALIKHIQENHIQEGYKHDSRFWPCPNPGCTVTAQQYLARLVYHLFERHQKSSFKPWKCSKCDADSSNLDALRRHVKRCQFVNSSSAAAPKLVLSATRSSRHPNKLLDKYIVLTQRLPCLWPLTTGSSTTVCNEKFENLEALIKHIQKNHIQEGYEHNSSLWPCPNPGCTVPAQQYLARLVYHLFERHQKSSFKPWKCSKCGAVSSNLDALRRHVKHHLSASSSSASASSSSNTTTT